MLLSLDNTSLFEACEAASTAAPAGFLTVLAFWRKYEEEALLMLLDPVGTHFRDAEDLQTLCERRGLPVHYIAAPAELAAMGIHEMRAFPKTILHEFYPANP